MQKTLITALFTIQFTLFGCAISHSYTTAPSTMGGLYSQYAYIGYTGSILKIEDIGVVTTDGLIKIKSVDGLPMNSFREFKKSGIYNGGRYQLHLTPGTHIITMGFHKDLGSGTISWSTTDVTKTITIAKGQIIHLSLSEDSRTWSAKEFDDSSAFPTIKNDFAELTSAKR